MSEFRREGCASNWLANTFTPLAHGIRVSPYPAQFPSFSLSFHHLEGIMSIITKFPRRSNFAPVFSQLFSVLNYDLYPYVCEVYFSHHLPSLSWGLTRESDDRIKGVKLRRGSFHKFAGLRKKQIFYVENKSILTTMRLKWTFWDNSEDFLTSLDHFDCFPGHRRPFSAIIGS